MPAIADAKAEAKLSVLKSPDGNRVAMPFLSLIINKSIPNTLSMKNNHVKQTKALAMCFQCSHSLFR